LLVLVSFLGALACYFFLPEKIPLHWGVSGEINSWGPRWNVIWMGALPVFMVALFRFLPRIDPLRASYQKHAKAFFALQVLLAVFFIGLTWLTIAVSFGFPVKVGLIVRGGMGLLFIGMGNFMGQLKRNYFVGIKTPWALADDEVWRRTHRRGAWVFVIAGAIFVASMLVPDRIAAIGLIPLITAVIVYVYAYSYFAFRVVKKEAERTNKEPS
jgi:uncharacterized membrane protein